MGEVLQIESDSFRCFLVREEFIAVCVSGNCIGMVAEQE